MKKQWKIGTIAFLTIFIVGLLLTKTYFFGVRAIAIFPKVFIFEEIKTMDYIKVAKSDTIINLSKVVTIQPTIWKGSYDGEIFYTDGSSEKIKISVYGDFFAIEGTEYGLFTDGVLYQYETEER